MSNVKLSEMDTYFDLSKHNVDFILLSFWSRCLVIVSKWYSRQSFFLFSICNYIRMVQYAKMLT